MLVFTNISIGGNYLHQQASWHQAEADVHYRLYRANADIPSGAVTLGAPTLSVNGEASIGSNLSVGLQPGTLVDGVVVLGESITGTEATYSGPSSQPLSRVEWVDPDPLGAVGGPLADLFVYYGDPANNDNAAAGLTGTTLRVNPHQELTLDSGFYYLTDYQLGAHATNFFNSTPANPVVIFLDGELGTQPSSAMITSSKSPQRLYIFSRSTADIQMQPNSKVEAFVYAPYANLRVQPGDSAYGIFWGKTATLQPSGDLYLDLGTTRDFVAKNFVLMSTKEVRE